MSSGCHELRELTAEVALGIAAGDDRARLLEHVTECAACRAELERFSAVADEMLLLTPEQDPPAHFEDRVLRALDPARPSPAPVPAPRRRRWSWRPLPRLALAAAVGATAASFVVLGATQSDRRLAADYRASLEAAHGSRFLAVPLRDAAGREKGALALYVGNPSWLVVTVPPALRIGVRRAEVVSRDGRTYPLPGFRIRSGVWGGVLPIRARDVAAVHLIGPDERTVLVAFLKPDW